MTAKANENSQIHIIGGGIAGLSAAVFAIRDGKIPGKNIHIYEELGVLGGAMDAKGSISEGYSARGARMINKVAYECMFDLLSTIPCLEEIDQIEKQGVSTAAPFSYTPKKTMKDLVFEFNETHKLNTITRLVGKDQRRIDNTKMGFTMQHRLDFLRLLATPESMNQNKRIDEYFDEAFFTTNFWYMFASVFGFEPWHSLIEMRRYLHRFQHDVNKITRLTDAGWNMPYNNYDGIIVPIQKWLGWNGVNFHMDCSVTDIDFTVPLPEKTVTGFIYSTKGKESRVKVNDSDFVFVTIGSKIADSREAKQTKVPEYVKNKKDFSWTLWERMATKKPGFGSPAAFSGNPTQTRWVVFTITSKGPLLKDLVNKFTGNSVLGEQHLITFVESSWFWSLHPPFQPFYKNQDKDTSVILGYGLYANTLGDYVKKTMPDCTGEELLTEACYHFGFMNELPELLKTTTVVSNLMPYATSHFQVRKAGDRPDVIPQGSTNLALLGQFVEVPDDCVFLVDYSVRSAQMGVYKLLGVDKPVTKVYQAFFQEPWKALRPMELLLS